MQSVHRRAARWGTASFFALVLSLVVVPRASAQLEQRLDALEDALREVYDGDPVTLEECIHTAEVGSVTLGRFEEDVLSAITSRRAAIMQWLPDLSASFNYQDSERTDLDQEILEPALVDAGLFNPDDTPSGLQQFGGVGTGEFQDVVIDQTFESQSLSSNWTVFNGLDRVHEYRQSNANLEASKLTLTYQRDVLHENVTNAYYDYIRAARRVEVARDAEDLAAQELERSETYFELGISTRSEVLQAKVRLQQTKLDVVRERNGERNAFLVLAHAMNIPGARPFAVLDQLPEVEHLEGRDLEVLLASARERRLDLAATEYALDASNAGVWRARAGYFPSIQVFAQYQRSKSETPFRFGAQENTSFAFGIQGQWAIFDRWRTQQQTRNAVAAKRRAEYDVRQRQLDIELEVVNLWNNLTEAIESHGVSTVAVEQSTEDLRLAEERFRVGAGTALDVITAQVNLAQARRDLVDAQVNAIKYDRQLQRATGATAMALLAERE